MVPVLFKAALAISEGSSAEVQVNLHQVLECLWGFSSFLFSLRKSVMNKFQQIVRQNHVDRIILFVCVGDPNAVTIIIVMRGAGGENSAAGVTATV
jgi:hypothetical protein